MTSVTNLLPMEETLMRCMFGYIGTGLQKLCVKVRCCHLGMKMYTRGDIQESLLITLLHFAIIFKTIQTISNWGNQTDLACVGLLFFSFTHAQSSLCCLCYILSVISQIGYFIDVLLLLLFSHHQSISQCLIFTRK